MKCAHCGATISLEPDANGGFRYYSGDGPEASTACVDDDGRKVGTVHVPDPKTQTASASSKGGES